MARKTLALTGAELRVKPVRGARPALTKAEMEARAATQAGVREARRRGVAAILAAKEATRARAAKEPAARQAGAMAAAEVAARLRAAVRASAVEAQVGSRRAAVAWQRLAQEWPASAGDRDKAAREQAAREQTVREQAVREQAVREQAVRERAVRERAVREWAARETAEAVARVAPRSA